MEKRAYRIFILYFIINIRFYIYFLFFIFPLLHKFSTFFSTEKNGVVHTHFKNEKGLSYKGYGKVYVGLSTFPHPSTNTTSFSNFNNKNKRGLEPDAPLSSLKGKTDKKNSKKMELLR